MAIYQGQGYSNITENPDCINAYSFALVCIGCVHGSLVENHYGFKQNNYGFYIDPNRDNCMVCSTSCMRCDPDEEVDYE